jgi:hypothetical protein
MSYFPYPYTGPTLCGSDSETQDDRFSLLQPGERQMPGMGVKQMSAPGESQGQAPEGSQAPISRESQVSLARESQGPDLRECQMPHEGDFGMLGPDQLAPDSPQDML